MSPNTMSPNAIVWRIPVIAALIASALPLPPAIAADSPLPHRDGASTAPVLVPERAAPSDILAGRGPSPHLRELRKIAGYAAIGNRDGMEMAMASLEKRGMSRRAIEQAISRLKANAVMPSEAGGSEPGY